MIHQHTEAPGGPGTEIADDVLQIIDAAEVLDDDTLDPQIIAPDLFDEFGVVAAFDIDPSRRSHPGARTGDLHRTRCRTGSSRSVAQWRGQNHRPTLDQETGPEGEDPVAPVPVLQFDSATLDAHDGADEPGLRVLNNHPDLGTALDRTDPPGFMRVVTEHVGAIAIGHPVILSAGPRRTGDRYSSSCRLSSR